jgi:predicted DNA-binding antitoxin AbrB/MazE fold protein
MITKAKVKNNSLILNERIDIPDGEEVEVIISRIQVIDEMYGYFKISDPSVIEELSESDDFE